MKMQESIRSVFSLSDRKKGKGKPKTVLDKYHLQCQQMIQKNFNDIMTTDCKREKQRIKNLNNSLLQRLKRRRE
jgi:non-homologous end joining protein Ku